MGHDATAVVDPVLRWSGMPTITRGNTNAPP
jgi:hypothetical protein